MELAPVPSRHRLARSVLIAFATAGAYCVSASGQNSVMAPVTTVDDAVFRSRWAGQQTDRSEALALMQMGQGIEAVDDFAAKLREGLHFGSLQFHPGLGLGWEYSDRNSQGGATTGGYDNQSTYIAPSLGLEYSKDTGPWSFGGKFDGGYTFLLNPNYSADGTGTSRNPFNTEASMGISHSGTRHIAKFGAWGSYGNGENIQAGADTRRLIGAVALSHDYLVNDFVTTGVFLRYDTQITRYEDDLSYGSDLSNLRAGGYIDWLWTGKTTLGVKVEAGRLTSLLVQEPVFVAIPVPAPAPNASASPDDAQAAAPATEIVLVPVENKTQIRQYAQLLGTAAHNLTAKTLIVAGLGASYTEGENIDDIDPQYLGLRPVYMAGVQYAPSEKTSLRLNTSMQGTDVVPSYGMSFVWTPRVTTTISLSAYQNQNFSLTSLSQYQVTRGFVLSASQVFFSKLTARLSGGWQQIENVALSSNVNTWEPTEYTYISGGLTWRINSWASWVATVRASTGYQSESTSNIFDLPETRASIGLNLHF